jgi:5-methylcytosine-specific restriction endonuclease McrA
MEQGTPKKEPQIQANCGTRSGYLGHRARNESSCEPCRQANTEYFKSWREQNRERYREISYAWNSRNPDKVRSNMRNVSRRRRAKKMAVESEPYTQDLIVGLYGATCHICLEEIDLTAPQHPKWGIGWELGLQLDHVVPLSANGTDKVENIRPAHAKCNILKGSKHY